MNKFIPIESKGYTIKTAAEVLKVTPEYVRTLIRNGRLATTREPLDLESKVMRHTISKEELERFLSSPERRGLRDGRRRYVVRLTDEQEELVHNLFTSTPGLEDVELERAFKRTDTDVDPDQDPEA